MVGAITTMMIMTIDSECSKIPSSPSCRCGSCTVLIVFPNMQRASKPWLEYPAARVRCCVLHHKSLGQNTGFALTVRNDLMRAPDVRAGEAGSETVLDIACTMWLEV